MQDAVNWRKKENAIPNYSVLKSPVAYHNRVQIGQSILNWRCFKLHFGFVLLLKLLLY